MPFLTPTLLFYPGLGPAVEWTGLFTPQAELSRATDKFKYILFADDTNLISNTCSFKNNYSQNNIDPISLNINVELGKISDWMSANKLSLNTSKSKFIIFSYRQKNMGENKIPTLTINGTPIERKEKQIVLVYLLMNT